MKAQRLLFATAGVGLLSFASFSSHASDFAKASSLGSLRGVEKMDSMFMVLPGTSPVAAAPPVVAVARPPTPTASPVAGMPRDVGTNLEGVLRDPRASRITPAGVRLAEPGWMRKAPSERR